MKKFLLIAIFAFIPCYVLMAEVLNQNYVEFKSSDGNATGIPLVVVVSSVVYDASGTTATIVDVGGSGSEYGFQLFIATAQPAISGTLAFLSTGTAKIDALSSATNYLLLNPANTNYIQNQSAIVQGSSFSVTSGSSTVFYPRRIIWPDGTIQISSPSSSASDILNTTNTFTRPNTFSRSVSVSSLTLTPGSENWYEYNHSGSGSWWRLVQASSYVVVLPSGSSPLGITNAVPANYGYDVIVGSKNFFVTHLGLNTITASTATAGIFDSSGNLLVQANLSTITVPVEGLFCYTKLERPIELEAGKIYRVVVQVGVNTTMRMNYSALATSGVSVSTVYYTATSSLTYPTQLWNTLFPIWASTTTFGVNLKGSNFSSHTLTSDGLKIDGSINVSRIVWPDGTVQISSPQPTSVSGSFINNQQTLQSGASFYVHHGSATNMQAQTFTVNARADGNTGFRVAGTTGIAKNRMLIRPYGNFSAAFQREQSGASIFFLNSAGTVDATFGGSGGQFDIGPSNGQGKFNVAGSVSIGTNFATGLVPTDGLAVEGNVGIGTDTPTSKLDISGGSITVRGSGAGLEVRDTAPEIRINSTGSSSNVILRWIQAGVEKGLLYFYNAGNFFGLRSGSLTGVGLATNASNTPSLFVSSNTWVGIGTTDPSQKFTVEGGTALVRGSLIVGERWPNVNAAFIGKPANNANPWEAGSAYIRFQDKNEDVGNTNDGTGIHFFTHTYNGGTNESMRISARGNVGIGTTEPAAKLDVNGDINIVSGSGLKINGVATSGNFLRGDGTRFVSSAIQAGDVGSAGTLYWEDNRTISPSELTATNFKFGFTSYTNNDNGPWADFLHMRSYVDSSGGLDNLLVFNRSGGFGARLYQQTYGSTNAYTTYKDVVLAENSPTANYLPKYSGTGNNVSVTNSIVYDNGKVGVGMSTPSAQLHVNESIAIGENHNSSAGSWPLFINRQFPPMYMRSTSTEELYEPRILMVNATTNSGGIIRGKGTGGVTITEAKDSPVEWFHVGPTGVKVGTGTSLGNLNVFANGVNGSTFAIVSSYRDAGTNDATSLLRFRNKVSGGGFSTADIKHHYNSAAANYGLEITPRFGSTGILTIPSSSVGISTNAAGTAKLVVGGTPGAEGLDLASHDQYANMRVIRNSLSSIDKDLYLQYQAGSGSRMYLYSNNTLTQVLTGGNVGIGTASPTDILHTFNSGTTGWKGRVISGNENYNMVSGVYNNVAHIGGHNYALNAWSDVYTGSSWYKPGGGSWGDSSDERLKINISTITGALDRISSLRGVSFNWRNPHLHSTGTARGFIAQEVEKVYPNWVKTTQAREGDKNFSGQKGEVKALELPFEFNAEIVEAIKELKRKNEDLMRRISILENLYPIEEVLGKTEK